MRTFLCLCLIMVGVVLGIYLGGWVLLIGGIVQAWEGLRASPISTCALAVGGFKVLLSLIIGWLTLWGCVFLAVMISGSASWGWMTLADRLEFDRANALPTMRGKK